MNPLCCMKLRIPLGGVSFRAGGEEMSLRIELFFRVQRFHIYVHSANKLIKPSE